MQRDTLRRARANPRKLVESCGQRRDCFGQSRHSNQVSPGRLNPDVTLLISALEISLAWPSAWLAAVRIISSSSCASDGLMACGSILTDEMVPSHLAIIFTSPPALVG